MSEQLYVAYSDGYQDWQLGKTHPTNPERALIAVELLQESLGSDFFMVDPNSGNSLWDRELLEQVHSPTYVADVIARGLSDEWTGPNLVLGNTALMMFSGTARLVEHMLAGDTRVAFNPQGAKHHAGYANSSGFCVFNDMAWAATRFMDAGMKVMYIDWDAHHGDGVENLLFGTKAVTCSIHEGGIFPGTGNKHEPLGGAYNWPLNHEAGGKDFLEAMLEVDAIARKVKPDVVLLAAGADAHATDPLSSLRFDYADYKVGAFMVADIAKRTANGRVLIGGAGGYQPLTNTPMIWAQVVSDIWKSVQGDVDVEAISQIVETVHPSRIREYVR